MKKLNIYSTITENDLLAAINDLDDDAKAKLAIRFGYNGDMTYELLLLEKLIKLMGNVYPSNCTSDLDMVNLTKSLLAIKPQIDNLLK